MNEALTRQVKTISEKLHLLLKQFALLQKENEALKSAMQLSSLEQEKCRKQLAETEQQLSILKMAAGEMTDTDKKEMEKRLNVYIREIDRCISYLQD